MNGRDMARHNQGLILRYLLGFSPEQWPPTIREIGDACELAPSTVLKNLRVLEGEGYIERGSGDRQIRVRRVAA